MKLHIMFPLKSEPSGGGNQFLLALREKFTELGCYAAAADEADVIIFNSYPFGAAAQLYARVAATRRRSTRLITVIHRVDGPIAVVRGSARDLSVDHSIAAFNQLLADGTVFQSHWSRRICRDFGIGIDKPETVIGNAPDSRWFHRPLQKQAAHPGQRLRIVATSWSANWRKGFDIYRYLDEALDHDRYEFVFVGNTPHRFRNIKVVPPLGSRELGEVLRGAHLYLAASVDDPCSNAVVEALHCGLPVVARSSGGHPELVGECGALFNGRSDVLAAIDHVADTLCEFPPAGLPDMDAVAAAYLDFAIQVHAKSPERRPPPHAATVAALWAGVARQRFWSGFTRKLTRTLPLRESRFHPVEAGFRTASWEPGLDTPWDEDAARTWVSGVLARLPLFLDSMRHPARSSLYRYSQSGDRQPNPSLAASVFVAKIMAMAGIGSSEDRHALVEHILSFEQPDGSITDPWVRDHSRWGRMIDAIRSRATGNLFHAQTVRAETRQAVAALRSLGTAPSRPFADLPRDTAAIDAYVRALDWRRPWGAASHISHLAFFMAQHAACFGVGDVTDAVNLLSQVEQAYRREDGAWYAANAQISSHQKVNGAMKMVTALDAAGVYGLVNAEGLIDICLAAASDGHACNHFNVICVLHRCATVSKYRNDEVRSYLLDRLRRYRSHYWPWQGGFSFFPGAANHSYYNARVTTGMAEPDVHGTVLMLWGIVLICDILGWAKPLGLTRTIV